MAFVQIRKMRGKRLASGGVQISVCKATYKSIMNTHSSLCIFLRENVLKEFQFEPHDFLSVYVDEDKPWLVFLRKCYDETGFKLQVYGKNETLCYVQFNIEVAKLTLPSRLSRRAVEYSKFEDGILVNCRKFD